MMVRYKVTHCLNELKTINYACHIVLQCGIYSEDLKYLAEWEVIWILFIGPVRLLSKTAFVVLFFIFS